MDHAAHMEENRRNWDDRAALHAAATSGYRLDRYRDDRALLSDVIEFDRTYLGDLHGLRVLHLQCHIGTDTLSLARLGADVTGLDQSRASIDAAEALFASVDTAGRFVEANVYDAVEALDGEAFDLVYTSVGVLNWLPDVDAWAKVAAALVRPGGRFHLREAHPMAMTIDDERDDDLLVVRYPYFQLEEPMTFNDEGTYVDTDGATIENTTHHEWSHGLGEVFTALTRAGLAVTTLEEHRFLDWKLLPAQNEVDALWYLPLPQRAMVPMQYTMQAVRPDV
ncbi:MAG: class I SAM-dependent methyltransferase [Ilumatobacter sp.]